ncbi:MAG TPA: dihydrofolate reductase family protein, partial [Acholeplasma sp.]|nr:dihydrofolate reductase family protein [Acholeplasma sp.]
LKELRKRGIYSLLVEGGSTVHFSFIKAGLFNRLYATISPIIIGGDLAKGAVGGKGFDYLVESQKLNFNKIMKRGADIIVDATPRKEAYYD